MKKRATLLLLSLLLSFVSLAQESDSTQRLSISGYIDVYFAAFSDSLGPNALQKYNTVSPRDRRFGVNVAQLGLHYFHEKVRGNLIVHYGDIMEATWDETFRFLQEANVGLRLAERLWLDAGFFATHIGTESFLPKNNLTSSTALATYNEPFFQSGARLAYTTPDERFYGEFWVLSGYNLFLDTNKAKSLGVLLRYALSEKVNITYANLVGRESPDGVEPQQYLNYHNLYLTTEGKKWQLVAGADWGWQSNSSLSDPEGTAFIYNALLTLRHNWSEAFSTTLRGEVFSDENGFISGTFPTQTGAEEGLQTWGLTFGTEYRPKDKTYFRIEGRYLQTPDRLPIFYDGNPTNERWEFSATLGLIFDQGIR